MLNICPNKVLLCRINGIGKPKNVYMESITEEDEEELDRNARIKGEAEIIKNGYKITAKDIFLYGEVNLNNDDDLDLIENYNLINENGDYIPLSFDYENGTIYTNEDGVVKRGYTTDPILVFKYNHCIIGKPKRIIVYKKSWK